MPGREVFWNVPFHELTYVIAAVVVLAAVILFVKRILHWRLGKPEKRTDRLGRRFLNLITGGLIQTKTWRSVYPGAFHGLIFWGFFVLFLGTVTLTGYEHFGVPVVQGTFYLIFSLVLDVFGLLVLSGITLAFIRRIVFKPPELDNRPVDFLILLLLGSIIVTGFLVESFRIAYFKEPYEVYSVVGWFVSEPFWGLDGLLIQGLHFGFWVAHLFLSLLFFILLPTTKLFHVAAAPAAAFFTDLRHPGTMKPTGDLETAEEFGITTLRDLTWRDILDFDACTRCGRCEAACPAHASDKPLSPKKVIQDLKTYFNSNLKVFKGSGDDGGVIAEETEVAPDAIWACTTCLYCVYTCPTYVEQMPKLLELRRSLVLTQDSFPAEVGTAFRNFETNSNPWGVGWAERAEWSEGLDVPLAADGADFEYLFFVGCAGSFDKRNIKVSKAFVNVLNAAGISFAILGTEEKCCGESARRLGHEFLFAELAAGNLAAFEKYGVKKIVTTCPHCYNTFKNEYPALGANLDVYHETELIARLIADGRLKQTVARSEVATFHDSCYLGRYNGIYAEPRRALAAAGVKIKEMKRHGKKSFCCGGGGGRMWLEETLGVHICRLRAEEAVATGTDNIVTACPYCLTMLEDGAGELDMEERVKVRDVAEVVSERFAYENR
jgi:Fe-S oxidoreductase/nitrate reductase gamma subunit